MDTMTRSISPGVSGTAPTARSLVFALAALFCLTHDVNAQGLADYRGFTTGSNVTAVSERAGVPAADAKTLRERPAVLQDLEWRPRSVPGTPTLSADPVEKVLFSFYNDQAFRFVVDYSPERTAGMTDADMVEALVTTYGTSIPRASWRASRVGARVDQESGTPLARWEDSGHAVVLYRAASYRPSFRLVVVDTRLSELARLAEAAAQRLDDQEAPARERAREQKTREDDRAAEEKARRENRGGFRP
jgi:hypothetical protein